MSFLQSFDVVNAALNLSHFLSTSRDISHQASVTTSPVFSFFRGACVDILPLSVIDFITNACAAPAFPIRAHTPKMAAIYHVNFASLLVGPPTILKAAQSKPTAIAIPNAGLSFAIVPYASR